MSDRNIRVTKEQRARETNVIPKAGTPNASKAAEAKKRAEAHDKVKAPSLSQLGVPINLKPPRPEEKRMQNDQDETRRTHPGEEGGDQAILDKDLPQGSENLLNTQESIYYSFYARLYEAIGPLWQSRIREVPHLRHVNPGDYTTSVDVVFDASGNLIGIEHAHDSGIPEFDQAVDTSWRKMAVSPIHRAACSTPTGTCTPVSLAVQSGTELIRILTGTRYSK